MECEGKQERLWVFYCESGVSGVHCWCLVRLGFIAGGYEERLWLWVFYCEDVALICSAVAQGGLFIGCTEFLLRGCCLGLLCCCSVGLVVLLAVLVSWPVCSVFS